MKKTSKALLLGLCALLLVGASVLGTMAYLTSQDEVVNTFTVGRVGITLDETDVDNSTPDAVRDQKNSYKLMPGHEYTKDPIVHVASGSEDCYLFVKVKNEIAGIEAAPTVATQIADKGWTEVTTIDDKTKVYVYTNKTGTPVAVSESTDHTVFENFKIAGTVNNDTLKDYANKTITVTAYAIQKDGFEGKSASAIWTDAGFNN